MFMDSCVRLICHALHGRQGGRTPRLIGKTARPYDDGMSVRFVAAWRTFFSTDEIFVNGTLSGHTATNVRRHKCANVDEVIGTARVPVDPSHEVRWRREDSARSDLPHLSR
jgi:hypothetical protein